ncbi:MAG: Bug family tripartite tricarboxylate transporter substrate binding protein [Burkholderiales bacterium]
MQFTIRMLAPQLLCALLLKTALAQSPATYPSRSIQVIVPTDAGALMDNFARVVTQGLTERLGQSIVVINRPGASEAIGAEAVAKATPDGYTMLAATASGLVLNNAMRRDLPYDSRRDFAPVSLLFFSPLWLVTHPGVPVNSVQDLVALAKSQPGKLTYASIGTGTTLHLAGELFKMNTAVDILHVPYKGTGGAVVDLLAGRVDLMFSGGGAAIPNIRANKVRALANTGPKRSPAIPTLPTMVEAGVPNFNVTTWMGLVLPAKTPRPIVDRLNQEVAVILRSNAARDRAAADSLELAASTPDELGERIRAEIPYWSEIVQKVGLQK